jgi:hypothetical protein
MIAAAVYLLCAATSALCAALLLAGYRRSGARLLLWSGASFAGFAVSNALVFADLVVLPETDLTLLRAATGAISIGILLFGLILDSD